MVCGGGCVDSAIAHFVRERARSLGEERSASSESPPVEPEHCAVVMEMVAQCFEALSSAVSGGHTKALTDSFSHHCWFASPEDVESMLLAEGSESPRLASRCNCGAIERPSISADTSWRVLDSAGEFKSSAC